MSSASRPSFEEYLDWHKEKFKEDLRDAELAARFNGNSTILLSTATSHAFMTSAASRLSLLLDSGVLQRGGDTAQLVLQRKPFESVIGKIYRLNCLWNRKWPAEPEKGWVTHDNCYVQLDDIIRGSLTSRYLDGPEEVCRAIVEAAEESGAAGWRAPKATDAGYYAWHAYVRLPAQIFLGGAVADINFVVEVQTATLLQSALRDLTHKLYERQRITVARRGPAARWDYGSEQFRAEYLGHALHLVDAMIVELRNAQQATVSKNEQEGVLKQDEENTDAGAMPPAHASTLSEGIAVELGHAPPAAYNEK